jgi:hypothetical protein
VLSGLASAGASVGLVLALAACTVATSVPPKAAATATATSTRATLTCAVSLFPMPFPPVQPTTKAAVGRAVELLCLVTGAPRSDTGFTLTFVITGQSPPIPPTSSPCVGMLQQGEGACTHTYLLGIGPPPLTPIAPKSVPFTAVVSGVLHPSGQRVGPVTPIRATAG